MGIWPSGSNGTDINGVDVCKERGYVLIADDFGFLSLCNYPCVVKHAPRKQYNGHSSFVENVRCLPGGDFAATVGGKDCTLILWEIDDGTAANAPKAKNSNKKYANALY